MILQAIILRTISRTVRGHFGGQFWEQFHGQFRGQFCRNCVDNCTNNCTDNCADNFPDNFVDKIPRYVRKIIEMDTSYIFVNHFIFISLINIINFWFGIAGITIGSLMALFLLFWFGLKDFVVWTQVIWIFAVNLRSHCYRRIRRYMNIEMHINFTMEFILPKILDGVIYKIVVQGISYWNIFNELTLT